MAKLAVCEGVISETGFTNEAGTLARCDIGWTFIEYQMPFDISQLEPTLIATYIGTGFFILVPVWVAVYGVRSLWAMLKGF